MVSFFFSSQTIHSTIIEYDRSSKNRPITDRKKSTPLRIYNSALKTTLSLWQTRFRRNRKLQRILFSPSNVRHTPIASAISSVHATYRFFHARNFTNVETNDRILRQSHGFFDPERRIDGDGGISRAFLGNESHFDLGSRSTTERVPGDRWRSICQKNISIEAGLVSLMKFIDSFVRFFYFFFKRVWTLHADVSVVSVDKECIFFQITFIVYSWCLPGRSSIYSIELGYRLFIFLESGSMIFIIPISETNQSVFNLFAKIAIIQRILFLEDLQIFWLFYFLSFDRREKIWWSLDHRTFIDPCAFYVLEDGFG